MEDLRNRALKTLDSEQINAKDLSQEELQKIVEELQVYQIELKMQNEELRDSQSQLELSRQKYFNLFEQAPLGYLVIDEAGIVQEANLKAAELFCKNRERIVNTLFITWLDSSAMSSFYEDFLKIKQGSQFGKFESVIRAGKDKKYIDIIISKYVDKNYLVQVTDITTLKQTLSELNERMKELKGLYKVSKLIESPDKNIDEILQSILDIIPDAMQYPDITSASLDWGEKSFKSSRYQEPKYLMGAEIIINNMLAGFLNIGYSDSKDLLSNEEDNKV